MSRVVIEKTILRSSILFWVATFTVAAFLTDAFLAPLFWCMLVGATLLPFIIVFASNQISSSRQTLSHLIRCELKKIKGPRWDWKMRFRRIYEPSWPSFFLVAGPLSFFWIIAHYGQFALKLPTLDFNHAHYQNLIAIHAGIGAIIIALVIFVAESLRDDEVKDRARVLLRESLLFPLTLLEILIFGFFLWGDVNFFSIAPIILVAIGAIWSFWRLISVLVSRGRFAARRTKLLTERLGYSMHLAVQERIGNHILLEALESGDIGLEYTPFTESADDYHIFSHEKRGNIVDVKLDRLREFSHLAERTANAGGFSFFEKKFKPIKAEMSSNPNHPYSADAQEYVKVQFYLLKKLGTPVDPDHPAVLCVDKKITKDPTVLKRLLKLSKEAFVVKSKENFSEEVLSEVSTITDQMVAAVRANQPKKVEEIAKTFITVAETFLEMINEYGGGFSYEQAKQERNVWPGAGWSSISWLQDNIWEVLQATNDVRQQHVARTVAYLPYTIAKRAIDRVDHYVFQTFLNFAVVVYDTSFDMVDRKIAELVKEKSYTHLKDIIQYYIEPTLKETSDAKKANEYGNFAKYTLKVLGNLLKASFDKNDISTFEEVSEIVRKSFVRFEQVADRSHAEYLKDDLKHKTDPEEIAQLKLKIEISEVRERFSDELLMKKQQIFLGLGAWFLNKLREKPDDEFLQKFYTTAKKSLTSDLVELTNAFIAAKDRESDDFWDWSSWEFTRDGEAHRVDFPGKLERFYCIRVLEILVDSPDEKIKSIKLPPSREMDYMADPKSSVSQFLDNLKTDAGGWLSRLNPLIVTKVEDFKNLLKEAAESQKQVELKRVIETALSEKKIQEFKNEIVEAHRAGAVLRKVFASFGNFSDISSTNAPHQESTLWGINQVDDKEAFIEDWHVHYPGWGSQYGAGMGQIEDQHLYDALVNNLTSVSENPVQVNQLAETVAKQLNENPLTKPVVILPGNLVLKRSLMRGTIRFVMKWNPEHKANGFENMNAYVGYLQTARVRVPVFEVRLQEPRFKQTVCVISGKDFGRVYQYPPISKKISKKHQYGIFSIQIYDLNQEDKIRDEIIAQKTVWLNAYQDKAAYLRQKVLIKIFEKIELKIKDPTKGFKVVLSPSGPGSGDYVDGD